MAVPERMDRPVQVMDVRDLARLVVLLVERDLPGAFNAVGPSPSVSFLELVKTCGDAELVPVPHGELDFPLLFPDPAWDAMLQISPAAALAAGMPRTPLAQTVADVRAWDRDRGEPPLGQRTVLGRGARRPRAGRAGLTDGQSSAKGYMAMPRYGPWPRPRTRPYCRSPARAREGERWSETCSIRSATTPACR